MAYSRTTWADGVTPVDASRLNNIEAGVDHAEYGSLIGEIKIWPIIVAPTKFLACDGAAISRSTYAALFALIGTLYGAGNGTTTFNLPDLRENVPVGFKAGSAEFGTIGATAGAKTVTLDATMMPAHTHSSIINDAGAHASDQILTGGADANTRTVTTSSVGGGLAHNNIQPSLTLNYIIRALD